MEAPFTGWDDSAPVRLYELLLDTGISSAKLLEATFNDPPNKKLGVMLQSPSPGEEDLAVVLASLVALVRLPKDSAALSRDAIAAAVDKVLVLRHRAPRVRRGRHALDSMSLISFQDVKAIISGLTLGGPTGPSGTGQLHGMATSQLTSKRPLS